MCNILCVGHLPIHLDSGRELCEMWLHKLHSCHKDCQQCKDLNIGWIYKPGCLDNQDQPYILHQRLGHIGCKDLLYSQVGIYIELCVH